MLAWQVLSVTAPACLHYTLLALLRLECGAAVQPPPHCWQNLPAQREAYGVLIVGSHHHLCLGAMLQLLQNIVKAPGTGTVLPKLGSRPTTPEPLLALQRKEALQNLG